MSDLEKLGTIGGVPVLVDPSLPAGTSRLVESGLHTTEAHAAITAELVRLTMGGRGPARPELRTDLAGRMAHLMSKAVVHIRDNARAFMAELSARVPRDTGTLR